MLQIELDRDEGPSPKKRVRRKKDDSTEAMIEEQNAKDLVIAAIPTEVLAPYTALLAGIVATIEPGESPRSTLRWWIYAAALVAIIAFLGISYVRNRAPRTTRKFPWAGTLAACVAFAAWGLVMPGSPLSVELSGDDLTIWTVILTIGGAFLVGLITLPLKGKAKGH